MSETKSKIVRADSKAGKSGGYGFSYASLSDIAKAGFEIPKMRIKPTDDGRQFIEYKDGDDWLLGAEIITEFKGAGMNDCQAYGSALTYARRYTAQLALGLAVDDDKNVKNAQPEKPAPSNAKSASEKQVELLKQLLGDKFDEVMAKNQPLTSAKASKLITAIKSKKAEQNTSELSEMGEPISLEDVPF